MQDGVGAAATFNNPEALACDGTNLFLADSDNQAIRKITLTDGTVSTITQVNGHIGSGITVSKDGSTIYFSDTTSNAVQRLDVASKNVTPLAPLSGP
jgi:sugar lactone lactonase YvrE